MLLVTGGAGFIGSNFVVSTIAQLGEPIVTLDRLSVGGSMMNLAAVRDDARHTFVRGDICDAELVAGLLRKHAPRAIVHFAAESHVDRSITGPGEFVRSNVVGTWTLLEQARLWWEAQGRSDAFRFLHVSTDEVYGSLGPDDPAFTEENQYAPNSPYAASKAGADHLVRAYFHTYKLPVLTTNCSNNYGPHQFPEKLIPLMISNAIAGKPLPVYGDGRNRRDWLYVADHCDALRRVLEAGRPGETYNIGGESERNNNEVVQALCALLERARPRKGGRYADLVTYVKDRPGHDRRYAMDTRKIQRELGWRPQETFESGIRKSISGFSTIRRGCRVSPVVRTANG